MDESKSDRRRKKSQSPTTIPKKKKDKSTEAQQPNIETKTASEKPRSAPRKELTKEIQVLISEFKDTISEYPAKGQLKEWTQLLLKFLQTHGQPEIKISDIDFWISQNTNIWITVPLGLDPRIVPKTRKKPEDFERKWADKQKEYDWLFPVSLTPPCQAAPAINPTTVSVEGNLNTTKPKTNVLEMFKRDPNHPALLEAVFLEQKKSLGQNFAALPEDSALLESIIRKVPAQLRGDLEDEDEVEEEED